MRAGASHLCGEPLPVQNRQRSVGGNARKSNLARALAVALVVSASVLGSAAPANAAEVTIVNPPTTGRGCDDNNVSLGQSFTATASGTLTELGIFIAQGSRDTTLTVYAGVGPNGAVLSSQNVSLTEGLDVFFLPTPVRVSAGGSYSFAIADGTCTSGGDLLVSFGQDYAGGAAFRSGGEPASLFSDLAFTAVIQTVDAYPFTGFFAPVDNTPIVNTAKSGSAVPVKFSLGGDRGLDIFNAPGSPTFTVTSCTNGDTDPIETVVAASKSGLSYDPVTGLYTYVWKTGKDLAGTCGTLKLNLNDGSNHSAKFQLR